MKKLVAALLLGVTGNSMAAVVCKKPSGVLVVRDACKRRETQVNMADFGAVGPRGPVGVEGPQGPQGVAGTSALQMVAHVASDGTLTSGSASSASRLGTGSYQVVFTGADLTQCSGAAAVGFGGVSASDQIWFWTIADTQVSGDSVYVSLYNYDAGSSSFVSKDSGFNLVVGCPVS